MDNYFILDQTKLLTMENRVLSLLHGWSLENTRTVPLGHLYNLSNLRQTLKPSFVSEKYMK